MLRAYSATSSSSFLTFGMLQGNFPALKLSLKSGNHVLVAVKRDEFKMKCSRHAKLLCVCTGEEKKEQNTDSNGVVKGVVNALTELLNVVMRGQTDSAEKNTLNLPGGVDTAPSPGDVESVVRIIKEDYKERSYFITGILSDGIYEADCYFADPTISFTGLELWKRNLQLLVPFLEDPSIELVDISVVNGAGTSSLDQGVEIQAMWILKTGLKLPWKPDVYVKGSTLYSLSPPDYNKIYKHIESWDISGLQALGMVFFGTKVRS